MNTLVTSFGDSFAIVFCFAFIGSSLKYIDQVFDENLFNKKIAQIFSIVTGILMGFLIAFDSSAATLLIAIIVGVGLTSKLDNFAHLTAASFAFIVPFFLMVFPLADYSLTINYIPLTLMIFSGVSDEFLDAFGDKKKIWILTTRPIMKLMAFSLALFGFFHFTYFFAMMAFDLSYIFTGWYSFTLATQKTRLGRLNGKTEILKSHLVN